MMEQRCNSWGRFAPWLFAVLVCGLVPSAILTAAEEVDLRGYGKVTATFAPGSAAFLCEDETHADWLLGKLVADLFWDAGGAATEKRLTVDSKEVVARGQAPYGWIVLVRVGTRVCAVGGDSEEALVAGFGGSRNCSVPTHDMFPPRPTRRISISMT